MRLSDVDPWGGEQLILCRDDELGLQAVISIDDATLGPAVGGVRMRAYPSDAAAIEECRRLAAAMTLKNAVAGVPYGGAKSVIVERGPVAHRDALMRRFGEFVAQTSGAYVPGLDIGTTVADLAVMGTAGADVRGTTENPSPWTALGVGAALRAAVAHVDGRDDLDGLRVVIQGAGNVGGALARDLAADGARIVVADLDGDKAERVARDVGGETVAPELALTTRCDVFAPCAVGRVVTEEAVGSLACRIVAGSANDVLADASCADLLTARGIAYVPDFVANAGGILQIHAVRSGHDEDRLRTSVRSIGARVRELLEQADASGATSLAAAHEHARRTLEAGRRRRQLAGSGAGR